MLLQGRKVNLRYVFYYTEKHCSFRLALDMANSTQPTDVVLNFGIWLRESGADTTCGALEPHWGDPMQTICPYMPAVCGFLGATHAFNVLWSTTAPVLDDANSTNVVELLPPGHNLNPVSACGYDFEDNHCVCVLGSALAVTTLAYHYLGGHL